jgi:hypothetical protein
MSLKNRQVLLASRPAGEPTPDNFRLVEAGARPGQMLLRSDPTRAALARTGRFPGHPAIPWTRSRAASEANGSGRPGRNRFASILTTAGQGE